MKKGNYFFSLALLAVFGLVSCDNEGNEGNGGNGGGGGTTNPGTVVAHPVSSIANNDGVSTFTYDANGRMTSGYDMYAGYFVINSAPLSVEVHDEGQGWKDEYVYNNIQTNSQGFITYADCRYSGEDNESGTVEKYEATGVLTCEYSGDGYLKEIIFTAESEGYVEENTYVLVWEDGNLMSISNSYRYKDPGADWIEDDGNLFKYTYGEGAVENSGIYLPEILDDFDLDFLQFAGYFGKTTKLMPTMLAENYSNTGDYTSNLTTEVDSKGRVVLIRQDNVPYMAYAYDGETASLPENNPFPVVKKTRRIMGRR